MRVTTIVAVCLALAAGSARAGIVVGKAPAGGAIGLLVPGHGVTVTRVEALRALRGQTGPPGTTVYVTLPPPGPTHNVRRYPVTVTGAGFHGLLTSPATRIPGLVSIGDLDGLGWKADPHPQATLRLLDRRLRQAHDARNWATVTLMLAALALAGVALLLRSRFWARAGLLALPAALATALVMSAFGSASLAALALGTLAGAIVGAALPFRPLLCLFLAGYLVALAAWPDVNSLAAIGPHPDGGGRFYGVTNEVETLLLAPVLAGGPLAGVLGLALVGWSKAGADGGGIVVLLAALIVLRTRRLSLLAGLGAVALAYAIVGIDAALGGSSHVTRTAFHPVRLAHTLGHRWRVSWLGVTASWHAALIAALTLAALVMFALLRPRRAVVDALLAGVAVSLVVNDTAADVLGFGALSCAVVWTLARLAPRCAGSPPSDSPRLRLPSPAVGARAWSRRPRRP